jgi:hypothetical protein
MQKDQHFGSIMRQGHMNGPGACMLEQLRGILKDLFISSEKRHVIKNFNNGFAF